MKWEFRGIDGGSGYLSILEGLRVMSIVFRGFFICDEVFGMVFGMLDILY